MMRAVFMGSDLFSVPVLRAMLTHGPGLPIAVDTVAVVTQPDRPAGRGRRITESPVKAVAAEAGITVLQPLKVRDPSALVQILSVAPELIVVASYGQILPAPLLDAPRHGALNLHPSLLPLYRGPSPITAPIIAGDAETGTTLMLMVPAMDAGPILAQERTPIHPEETGGELRDRLAAISGDLLVRCLPDWLAAKTAPNPQNDDAATYTSRLRKEDGRVEWTESATLIARKVRAYNPWPVAFTFWGDRQVSILRATAVAGEAPPGVVRTEPGGRLLVGTGDGLLKLEELQLAGSRALPASSIVMGHPSIVGSHWR